MITTIHDVVTYFDGSVASGKIILTWPPFQYAGVAVAAGQMEYPLAPDGSVTIQCYPNIGAQPLGTYYTATYELDRGAVYDEYWLVPATASTTIGAIRASVPATPSIMINAQQLTGGGALPGQFLGWSGSNWVPMFVSNFNCAVRSFFGRIGDVMPQTGDYTVAQVTGAVPETRQIIAGSGLAGGGPLSADVTLSLSAGGFVPPSRQIVAGYGLGGGGPLSSDVSLYQVDNTTVQRVQVGLAGTVIGTRHEINFIAGSGTSLSVVDNGGANDRVDVTVSLSGTGPATPSIYSVDGSIIGTQPELNLITGSNVTLTGTNNGAANRVDIKIDATASAGGVTSIFTPPRTGAVVAQTGDYTAAQVTNAVDSTASYANPGWITSLAWNKITGVPATGVSSVFTRVGAVTAQTGDYTAAQVTNAVSTIGSYADPAWITSLSYGKLTGVPPNVGLWQLAGGGAIYYNGGPVGIGVVNAVNPLDVVGLNPMRLRQTLTGTSLSAGINDAGGQNNLQWYKDPTPTLAASIGIGSPAGATLTGDLFFSTYNGTLWSDRMKITNAGLVGIGTMNPGAALDVVNTGATQVHIQGSTGQMYLQAGSSSAGVIQLWKDLSFGSAIAIGNGVPSAGATTDIVFSSYGGTWLERMRITAAGTVGIGVTAPSSKLEVADNVVSSGAGSGFVFRDRATNTNGWVWYCTSGLAYLYNVANGNTPIIATPTSNVGIHNVSPSYSLDVGGDCNITGVYRINGTPISSGGGPTVQNVVTGSRSLGTIYPNSSGKALYVCVIGNGTNGATLQAQCDTSSSNPSQIVAMGSNGGGTSANFSITFVVVPGNYYRVTMPSGGTMQIWTEWN